LLTTYQPVFVLGTLLEPESSAAVAVEVEAAAAAIVTFSLRKAGNAEGDRKSTEPEPEPEPESAKKPNEGPVLVHSLIARRLSVFGPTLFGGVGDGGVQSAEPMRYFWAIHPA
jgi:hypothetical protein